MLYEISTLIFVYSCIYMNSAESLVFVSVVARSGPARIAWSGARLRASLPRATTRAERPRITVVVLVGRGPGAAAIAATAASPGPDATT